jgi:hypothetical protein
MNQSQLSLMLPTHLCGQSQCRAVVAGTAIPIPTTMRVAASSPLDLEVIWLPPGLSLGIPASQAYHRRRSHRAL